jgi:hypothetical protein
VTEFERLICRTGRDIAPPTMAMKDRQPEIGVRRRSGCAKLSPGDNPKAGDRPGAPVNGQAFTRRYALSSAAIRA